MEKATDKSTEWAIQLKEELEKRTGRKDIEVTISSYCNYDALISMATEDKHPIVNFYSDIQGNPARIKKAIDYAVEMTENWEVSQVMHEKAKQDALPFFARLKEEFPHLTLIYSVIDFSLHSVRIQNTGAQFVASFDLWPRMSEHDVNRIVFYIKDLEATLHRENVTAAGVNYTWK